MPKVSVIVPIYNVENYLHQTLDSLTHQTLRDIEILCVNDASPDRSKEIIERFAAQDPRVKLIDLPENRGTGLARKAGILASTGDYIMFLDGDDYFTYNACQRAYNAIEDSGTDMLHFGIKITPMSSSVSKAEIDGLKKLLKPLKKTLQFERAGELVRACFEEKLFGFNITNKIIRGDIVRSAAAYCSDERFTLAEDLYLFYLIAMFSKSYSSIDDDLYNYRFGAGITGGKSITNKILENRIRQGRIVRLLTEFSEKFDPNGITEKSLKDIEELFLSGVFYGWKEMSGLPDWNTQIPLALECFGREIFLGYSMYHYQTYDYRRKVALIDSWKNSGAFEAVPRKVRTVATFYHRMYNGGVERVMSKLIPMWTQMGYRVILFTDEIASPKDYPYGDNVVRITLPTVVNLEAEEYTRRITFLENMLRLYEVDLMVYHAWVGNCLESDILTVKSLHIPFIVHTHGFFACAQTTTYAPGVVRSILLQKLYTLVDGVITLSETDYSWWSMIHPRVYKTLNPLTFDLDKVQISEKSSYRYDILWVGRVATEKQPFDAVEILQSVLASGVNATLHMVGDFASKEYGDKLKKKIEELGLTSNIVLHGYQTDVFPFFRESNVLLFTSKLEGAPMTLAESLSSGVPVVMYNLAYLDLPRNNPGVVIVPQNGIAAAADALVDILTHPEKRSAMSKAARRSVEEAYSFDLPAFWEKIFEDVGEQREVVPDIKPEMLRNAMLTLNDHNAEGMEEREIKHPQTVTVSGPQPWEYKDVLLQMYGEGRVGFRYIIKYALAWLKFKLTGKRK